MTIIGYGAAFAAALALAGSAASAETTLRVVSGWPSTIAQVSGILPAFEEAVTRATDGDITFQDSGPETVPSFEQLQPLSAGVFDLMYSTPAYHQSQNGIFAALDSLVNTDPQALRDSGARDIIDKQMRDEFGVVLLAYFAAPANTIILRDPLRTDNLDGLKIRTNPAHEGMVRALGGTPVAMSPADAYAAMEKGVLDGIAFPIHASADYRLYEVGKYMTMPGYGHSMLILMANAASFDALPEADRKAIVDAARQMEVQGAAYMAGLAVSQKARMEENGVKITEFSPETSAKMAKMFADGNLAVARKSNPAAVDAFMKMIDDHGMASR